MSPRRPRADDAGQLLIDWNPASSGVHAQTVASPSTLEPEQTSASSSPAPAAAPPLVQRLPWDFEATFPEPTPQAIEAGLIEDEEIDTVRWIHLEHAKEALAVLHELDAVLDARLRGVDPATGKPPRTANTRERLRKFFQTEPTRLEQWYQTLMDTYEEAFGNEARQAFDKALRARHAGIPVVAEPARTPAEVPAPEPPKSRARADNGRPTVRESRRIVARLPVPKPLPSAVTAGHFGQDERGRPIRPGTMEIRAITERHAEKLIDLLDSIASAPASAKDNLSSSFTAGIAAYAESFGQHAADQLDAYVRRQVQIRDLPYGPPSRRR